MARRESKISGALLHRHLENSFKNLPFSEDPLQNALQSEGGSGGHDHAGSTELSDLVREEELRSRKARENGHFASSGEGRGIPRSSLKSIGKSSKFSLVLEWFSNQSVWELATLLSPLLKQLAEYQEMDDSSQGSSLSDAQNKSESIKDSNQTIHTHSHVQTPHNGNSADSIGVLEKSNSRGKEACLKSKSTLSHLQTTISLFLRDLKSAITVTLISVPFAIAYSSLAQVSPVNGLVSASIPSIIYSLIGTSAHICIGPESVVSIMVGMGVRDELAFAGGGNGAKIASCLGMMCGIFGLGMSFFQTGFLADVLAGYLLLGFITGVANLIMVSFLSHTDLIG